MFYLFLFLITFFILCEGTGYMDKMKKIIEEIKLNWEEDRKTFVSVLLFGAIYLYMLINIMGLFNNVFFIDYYNSIIAKPFVILFNFLMCIFPFALWVYSSSEEFFYYKRKKMYLLYGCVFNVYLIVSRYIVYGVLYLTAPLIFKIKPDEAITQSNLVWAVRIIAILALGVFTGLYWINIGRLLNDELYINKIKRFNIKNIIDMRENKGNLYDQNIIKDSETGAYISYLQGDRFMHQFFQGSSGVGKTALLVKMIFNDFKKKSENRDKREIEYRKMISAGEAYLLKKDGKISPENIKAFSGYEEKLKEIKNTFPDCGYTIIGPDEDLPVKIADLCDNIFGFDYYLCDPEKINGKHKPHYKGINPYHLPKNIKACDFPVSVAMISRRIADVLQAIFDETGGSDPYFKGINTTCTVNVSVILMAGMPWSSDAREPKLTDLSKILMRFERIDPYLKVVKERYGEGEDNPFYHSIDFVSTEMRGDSKTAKDLWNQARGLRDILDNLLDNPYVAEVLCSDEPIDFKEVLDEGKIVLFNFGFKYGRSVAKGLGLFYILTFHEEVKNRDLKTDLVPHFEVVDEISLLLDGADGWIATAISILRKYKIAATFAFQSNSQFLKNQQTKALDGLMRSVGQMVVFGRMDEISSSIYNKLAGKEVTRMVQDTESSNSLFSENPSSSKSRRITKTREDYADVADLRNTDFLEVNVFPVKNGNVLPVKKGKFFFVTKKERKAAKKMTKGFKKDWTGYVKDESMILTNEAAVVCDEDVFSFEELQKEDTENKTKRNIMG